MNPPPVTIKSYLPEGKRERSKLQQLKDKHRSFTETNKEGIPKDLNELKLMKYREHAITFLNQYLNINKKTSKSQYCKTNQISHNSLNVGLEELGYKTRVKQTNLNTVKHKKDNLDQMSPIETNQDQSRPIKHKKVKSVQSKPKDLSNLNPTEVTAGTTYEDEEINDMINNSLANLHTS